MSRRRRRVTYEQVLLIAIVALGSFCLGAYFVDAAGKVGPAIARLL